MKKVDKVKIAIENNLQELKRLRLLEKQVEGNTLEDCPNCKTRNYHWEINNKWVCAFC